MFLVAGVSGFVLGKPVPPQLLIGGLITAVGVAMYSLKPETVLETVMCFIRRRRSRREKSPPSNGGGGGGEFFGGGGCAGGYTGRGREKSGEHAGAGGHSGGAPAPASVLAPSGGGGEITTTTTTTRENTQMRMRARVRPDDGGEDVVTLEGGGPRGGEGVEHLEQRRRPRVPRSIGIMGGGVTSSADLLQDLRNASL